MSGEAGRLGMLLVLLALGAPAAAAAARPAGGDPGAGPARQMAPLREPRAVHERLQIICAEAGFRGSGQRGCAESITRACQRAGIAPDRPACWQWLVDRDVGGQLDRKALQAAGAPGRSRN